MYLKTIKAILSISLILFFIGCSAKGPKFSGFDTPKDNEALLYVYRDNATPGFGVSYSVNKKYTDDNESINFGTLIRSGYLKTSLKPNEKVEIWARTEAKSSVSFQTEANKIYCIKGSVGIGLVIGRPHLKAVDFDTCKKGIVKLRYSQD